MRSCNLPLPMDRSVTDNGPSLDNNHERNPADALTGWTRFRTRAAKRLQWLKLMKLACHARCNSGIVRCNSCLIRHRFFKTASDFLANDFGFVIAVCRLRSRVKYCTSFTFHDLFALGIYRGRFLKSSRIPGRRKGFRSSTEAGFFSFFSKAG